MTPCTCLRAFGLSRIFRSASNFGPAGPKLVTGNGPAGPKLVTGNGPAGPKYIA